MNNFGVDGAGVAYKAISIFDFHSLDVLTIRRKIADDMRDNGGWLKHPNKGFIKTILKVLDKWTKVFL